MSATQKTPAAHGLNTSLLVRQRRQDGTQRSKPVTAVLLKPETVRTCYTQQTQD